MPGQGNAFGVQELLEAQNAPFPKDKSALCGSRRGKQPEHSGEIAKHGPIPMHGPIPTHSPELLQCWQCAAGPQLCCREQKAQGSATLCNVIRLHPAHSCSRSHGGSSLVPLNTEPGWVQHRGVQSITPRPSAGFRADPASSKGKSRESKIERNYAGNWCNGSQLPAVLGYIMIAELRNALQVFLAEAVSGGRSSECRTAVRCCSPIPCAQWAHIHPAAYSPGNSPACSSSRAMLPPLSLCSHPSESSPAWALPAPSLPSYPVLRVQSLQRAADIRTLTALSPLPGPGSAPCPPARALGCIRAPRIALCQKEGWI